ncbi:isochorismatase family protein [Egicoccus sp. AB-alg2]|uniref:isochorismatase family protein n=1 Tax=Egicoccus sp. AB-alg2 TaxID=3242693 RepID=UPI00359DCCE6
MTQAYDPTTALIVVDLQHDFAEADGNLYVPGGEQVVPLANAEIEAARAAGAPVIYTQDWHPETTPHFQKDGGIWPVHCVHDTWGAEFHEDLVVDGPVVRKGVDGRDGYSGFSVRDPVTGEQGETRLGHLLRDLGVRRIVLIGLAGDYCVRETALDGLRLGYEVVVPLEGTRFVELQEGDAERTIAELREAGATLVGAAA